VMVTHDMAEALLLADRVLVMDAGQLVADETPRALLAGAGGEVAQSLVAVPRQQAERLAAAMPGWEARPAQLQMAERVRASLDEGSPLLVEAGTGTGKSLAYLVPAVLLQMLPVIFM